MFIVFLAFSSFLLFLLFLLLFSFSPKQREFFAILGYDDDNRRFVARRRKRKKKTNRIFIRLYFRTIVKYSCIRPRAMIRRILRWWVRELINITHTHTCVNYWTVLSEDITLNVTMKYVFKIM